MKIADKIKSNAVLQLYDYLDKDPENNIFKAFDLLEKIDTNGAIQSQAKGI